MQIERIKLPDMSNAERAILKRSAGRPLAEAGRALGIFYALKPPEIKPWQEEALFAVLCMSAMWREDERGTVKPMEDCLRRIRQSDSLDHRIMALLDTSFDGGDGLLTAKLSRLARQIRTSGEPISPDFPELFKDLLDWDSTDRRVQKNWARTYFVNQEENNRNDK